MNSNNNCFQTKPKDRNCTLYQQTKVYPYDSIVHISQTEIRLRHKVKEGDAFNEIKIKLKDLDQEKIRKGCTVNVQDMQDRLLQFNNKELQMIQNAYHYFIQEQQVPQVQQHQLKKWKAYINEPDEQYFLQQQTQQFSEEVDFNAVLKKIEQQEKQIDDFQTAFPQFKKQLNIFTSPSVLSRPNQDRITTVTTPTAPKQNGPFPPGYVPPHLVKQTAHDGLNSDQHLRFQANQSKKDKLKLAKQLLKMGFSTAQVIQKLQAQQRNGKSGYVDPIASPSNPSLRGAHLRSPVAGNQPMQKPQGDQVSAVGNNERAVKQMLISLIRSKQYKKLDDIQKHMASQGLQTTIQNLRKIIDQIKVRNAQRKAQQAQKAQE